MKFLIILIVDCFYIHTKTMLKWMMLNDENYFEIKNLTLFSYIVYCFTTTTKILLIYFAIKSEWRKLGKTLFEK